MFMPRTADICQTSGLYKVIDHPEHPNKEITIVKGKQFPPCDQCSAKVLYQLVKATPY